MMSADELKAEVAKQSWFHAIDFGEFRSSGRFAKDFPPPNASLFGVMDLLQHVDVTGLHCLDIGTVDGLVAFNMKSRGAARVVGSDLPARPRETFKLGQEALGLDVEFSGDTAVSNIVERLGEHSFDVVVCSGVMYHMLHPFDAVLQCRRLLKRNGILILQTLFLPNEERPIMEFNPATQFTKNLATFWVPSQSAVSAMLALGGFEVVATRSVSSPTFTAALAINVPLVELTTAPPMVNEMHARGMKYSEFRRGLPPERSSAQYLGPRDHKVINSKKYIPAFYPHPPRDKEVAGMAFVTKVFGP